MTVLTGSAPAFMPIDDQGKEMRLMIAETMAKRRRCGRKPMVCLMSVALSLALPIVAGEPSWARPELVEKVARGELTEVNVSWWGYDAADATAYLQAAFDSRAERVILDCQSGPWFICPMRGRSNLTLVVPEGVTLCAKRGDNHGTGDSLLRFDNATNVMVSGGGTLKMWLEDYTNKAIYAWGEWRHALAFRNCGHVIVENLSITDSGGDGIYVGSGCSDVTIRHVVLTRNNRQGISVISADRMLVEDCVMELTCGTNPMAGIDFEPNNSHDMLRDIVVRNCVSRGNKGEGFNFSVGNLNADSPEIAITIENCRSEGNARPMKFNHAYNALGGGRGAVTFRNCVFNDLDGGRTAFRSPSIKETMSVTFNNCKAADPDNGGELTVLGPEYGWERVPRPVWPDGSTIRQEPASMPDPATVTVFDSAPGQSVRIANPVPIRGKASFFIYAEAARTVRLLAVLRKLGRQNSGSGTIDVFTSTGETLASIKLEPIFGREQGIVFDAPASGFYRLETGSAHVLSFCGTDAPLALVGSPGWFGRSGTVFLRPHADRGPVAVSATGGGFSELVHVRLWTPDGKCAWDVDNIGGSEFFFFPEDAGPGLWKLETAKPSKGYMDDYCVGVIGKDCPMFLTPEKTWMSQDFK